jgi:signal transduction histidine kinase/CheY-like chemotaxis protein
VNASRPLPNTKAGTFRLKLFGAIMLLVLGITGAVLVFAQRQVAADAERELKHEFGGDLVALHSTQKVRLAVLAERCRAMANSVRIRAALEESDAADLYRNAGIELRDILMDGETRSETEPTTLRAKFYRFLDATGAVITPPQTDAAVAPWESQLATPGMFEEQQTGYIVTKREAGHEELSEVIATPIVATNTGEVIGAMVLGFEPIELGDRRDEAGLKSGIWLNERLHLPSISRAAVTALAGEVTRAIATSQHTDEGMRVETDGRPYLLFCKRLNPGSHYPPAFEVCIFPLADTLARQEKLRWQILGVGALFLIGGFGASRYIASRLSAPVEKLAEDSEQDRAKRERAESELKLTDAQLLARNAELKKALDELRATQQNVIQQERMHALGQMASGIAHDFNNALVPILGYCQLLQLRPNLLADKEKTTSYLEIIHTAAHDAANVVSRLHEFYRPNRGGEVASPVDLKYLVEQAIKLTQPRWKDQAQGRGATVRVVSKVAVMPPVAGNESALREMLTNLVFNAVDAMPQGGTISITARREGETARLQFSDTGIGMSDEVRRRCLEPFFSTKGHQGTGLGLSMVFGIVERHKGSLDLQSEPGKGTTFVITLPFHRANSVAAASLPSPEKSRSLNVLVVDDEPRVRELLRETLHADGHTVDVAEGGAEGLRKFSAGTFDLVVTDKAMPGMSGDQLALAIKQRLPRTPIVLLTGFGQFLDKEKMPFVDVLITKPVDLLVFRQAIAAALAIA